MRGKPGTSVRLTIVRPGRDRPFDVNITRAIIDIPAVRWRGPRRRRHHHRHHLQPGHHRGGRSARWPTSSASSATRRSAMSSTCAPIRAACSTRRSASPTCSSSAARSSRSAAAAAPTSSAITPGPGDAAHGLPIDRAGRRRHRLGLRDRRRRAAGPSPRDRHGRAHLRQGLGPDPAAARRRQHRAPPHHRALLHAVGPLGAGRRDHARHRWCRSSPIPITGSRNRVRESDLRRHLVNEIGVQDDLIQDDGRPDPRFAATAEQLTQRGHHRLSSSITRCRRSRGSAGVSRRRRSPARAAPAAAAAADGRRR